MLTLADCESQLRQLAHQMLRQFPSVRRRDQTDDVLQEALLRLHRALAEVQPQSDQHLLRLAALQMRRVLIDLARRYAGREHFAANHETWGEAAAERLQQVVQDHDGHGPTLAEWSEFHLQVEQLPVQYRNVFDLLWYMGLCQREAARTLGVTERSVQRYWRDARLLLHRRLAEADAATAAVDTT